ncbi:MAG: hypothetical protein ACREF3_10675, partial [Acetobacteraceae bacterium]
SRKLPSISRNNRACAMDSRLRGNDEWVNLFVRWYYCLQVTLKRRLKALAGGLTPRAVLDKMAAIQVVDVHSAHDGRTHHHARPLYRA